MSNSRSNKSITGALRAAVSLSLLVPFLLVSIITAPSAHATACTTAPTNVSATYLSTTSVTLTWTAPTPCAGHTISSYTISRTSKQSATTAPNSAWYNSGDIANVSASVSTYNFTGLQTKTWFGFVIVTKYILTGSSADGNSAKPSTWTGTSTAPGTGAMSNSVKTELSGATPTISSYSNVGYNSTTGLNTITITGTNLTGTTSVTFGGTAGTSLTNISATSISVVVPAKTAGAQTVVLVATGGTTASTPTFTYAAPPSITSLDKTVGSTTAGATTVTITGANLLLTTGVTFGAVSYTHLTLPTIYSV